MDATRTACRIGNVLRLAAPGEKNRHVNKKDERQLSRSEEKQRYDRRHGVRGSRVIGTSVD